MVDCDEAAFHGYETVGLWGEAAGVIVRRLRRGEGVTEIPKTLPGYRIALSLASNDAWLAIGARVRTNGAFPRGDCVVGQPGDAFDGEMRGAADVLLFLMEPAHVAARLEQAGLVRASAELRDLPSADAGLGDLASLFVAAGDSAVPGDCLYCEILRAALIERILLRHATDGRRRPLYRETLAPARLRRLIDFIETHIAGDLRLWRLGEIAALSPAHLARAFRNAMGMPVHQYIVQRRLARVRDALRRGETSIACVARSCGFFDESHLTKAYRRAFGVSVRRAASLGGPDA